jgi:hypothetical protein
VNSLPLNIAIVPRQDISNQAIDLSHSIESWGTYFTLSENSPIPHISIYKAEFPIPNISEIERRMRNYVKNLKRFSIEPVAEVYRKEDRDFVEVQYVPSISLSRLQTDIVKLLNPLRDGLIRIKDKDRLEQLSKEEQENLQNWGDRTVSSQFRPHLTLSRLKDPNSMSPSNLPQKDFSFEVNKIGIFELGDHGTCIKQIGVYRVGT